MSYFLVQPNLVWMWAQNLLVLWVCCFIYFLTFTKSVFSALKSQSPTSHQMWSEQKDLMTIRAKNSNLRRADNLLPQAQSGTRATLQPQQLTSNWGWSENIGLNLWRAHANVPPRKSFARDQTRNHAKISKAGIHLIKPTTLATYASNTTQRKWCRVKLGNTCENRGGALVAPPKESFHCKVIELWSQTFKTVLP